MDKTYYNNLAVSSAPHLVSKMDTSKTMLMVILALVPSFLVSIYVFGMRVILLTLVCVVASVGFEWLYNKAMKKRQTAGDLSAALTGVLIAFNVPSNFPYLARKISVMGTQFYQEPVPEPAPLKKTGAPGAIFYCLF